MLHWQQEAAWEEPSYYWPSHDNMAWPAAVLLLGQLQRHPGSPAAAFINQHHTALSSMFRGWMAGQVGLRSCQLACFFLAIKSKHQDVHVHVPFISASTLYSSLFSQPHESCWLLNGVQIRHLSNSNSNSNSIMQLCCSTLDTPWCRPVVGHQLFFRHHMLEALVIPHGQHRPAFQIGLFAVCCCGGGVSHPLQASTTHAPSRITVETFCILSQASASSDYAACRTNLRRWSAGPRVASLGQQVEPPCQRQLQQALLGCCGLRRTQQQGLLESALEGRSDCQAQSVLGCTVGACNWCVDGTGQTSDRVGLC